MDATRSVTTTPGLLTINFAGCTPKRTQHGTGYTYTYLQGASNLVVERALAITERQVAYTNGLDILGAQSGQLSYAIIRNGTLALPFQYVTPPYTLPQPLLPHVEQSVPFDVTTLTAGSDDVSLSEYLINYLSALLATPMPNAPPSTKVQIILDTAYPSDSTNNGMPMVASPITFVTARDININSQPDDVADLAHRLSDCVIAWSKKENAAHQIGEFNPKNAPWNGLNLRIRLALHAEWDGVGATPLLSLTGAYVPFGRCADLG
jgi:hypothetical protein